MAEPAVEVSPLEEGSAEKSKEGNPDEPTNTQDVTKKEETATPQEKPETEAPPQGKPGKGKVIIITGANAGIGRFAAETLAKLGYDLILACRSEERGQQTVKEIKFKVSYAEVQFMKLDLGSLASVRSFVDAFHATGKALNVLVNNAGLADFYGKQALKTDDGFEMTFGVNHLGHFLLTNLLTDDLKKAAESDGEARLVVVASMIHDPQEMKRGSPPLINFDNLQLEAPGSFDGALAYKNSKLSNVLFTYEISRRLEGSGVTANCLCPGFIPETSLLRNVGGVSKFMMKYILSPILKFKNVTRTVDDGGNMIVHVATKAELKGVTGKYFKDFAEKSSSKDSYDTEVAKRLWDVSAKLVKLEGAVSS